MAKEENKYPEFYGESDRDDHDGHITSFTPSWENKRQIEEDRESVEQLKRNLELSKKGLIPFDPGYTFYAKQQIEKAEEKIDKIEGGKPELTEQQKDNCYEAYKEIKKELRERLPTMSEMEGYCSDQDLVFKEADAMSKKTIDIDPELARAANVRMENGKITRSDLSKIFARLGKVLELPSSEEVARRAKITIRSDGKSIKRW